THSYPPTTTIPPHLTSFSLSLIHHHHHHHPSELSKDRRRWSYPSPTTQNNTSKSPFSTPFADDQLMRFWSMMMKTSFRRIGLKDGCGSYGGSPWLLDSGCGYELDIIIQLVMVVHF
ncbi:hypothetical protein KSS87_017957, partial [Heliosperma pusillum]